MKEFAERLLFASVVVLLSPVAVAVVTLLAICASVVGVLFLVGAALFAEVD